MAAKESSVSEGQLHFTVDARLVEQLGQQLVPSDTMALAELVKNAYDADASNVTIDYLEDDEGPCIVVEDDGNGMSLEELEQSWMRIGTSQKLTQPFSPRYGRTRAGMKGIGRFAAQRLGKRLVLSTTPRGQSVAHEVVFNWEDFTSERSLEKILFTVVTQPSTGGSGTRLVIRTSQPWTKEDLAKVLKELVQLYSFPKDIALGAEDPGFEIVAAYHGEEGLAIFQDVDLLKEERVMHLHGEVDSEGHGEYRLEFFRPPAVPMRVPFGSEEDRSLRTGPLTVNVDLFVFRKFYVESLGTRKAQEIAREHGGIRIRRDGFLIQPYGIGADDDWLRLDQHTAARRPPLNMWRNQQTMGEIRITRQDNPNLVDLLTRRSLLENEAFSDLRTFLFEGLRQAALEHAALTHRKTGSPGKKPPLKPSEALAEEIQRATSEGSLNPIIGQQLVKVVQEAERERDEDLLREQEMLRVLASLGTGIAVFAHEMKSVATPVAVAKDSLLKIAERLSSSLRGDLLQEVQRLDEAYTALLTYSRYVEEFISLRSRRRRVPLELEEFFQEFRKVFSRLLEHRQIRLDLQVPPGLFTCPLHRAELMSIVFNLVTNAVKALMAPGVRERRLLIRGEGAKDKIAFTVADTGCGIPPDIADAIFDPFVHRSHDPRDDLLGQGTGLGLFVLREIVEDNDGTVSIVPPPPGYVTGFRVELPSMQESF
jgi:signal transduction histidine kinase